LHYKKYNISKFLKLLTKEYQIKFIFILLAGILLSVVETVGVSIIMPFITLASEPLKILQDANLLVLILQRSYDRLPTAYTTVMAPWHITNSDQRQITYDSRFITGGLYNIFDEWLKGDYKAMPVNELVTTTLNTIKRIKNS